jgi:hypothetical protein
MLASTTTKLNNSYYTGEIITKNVQIKEGLNDYRIKFMYTALDIQKFIQIIPKNSDFWDQNGDLYMTFIGTVTKNS